LVKVWIRAREVERTLTPDFSVKATNKGDRFWDDFSMVDRDRKQK
jgi:hypothetical protein